MNKSFLIGAFVSLTCCVYSQQNTVSAGQTISGSGGSVSLSIGQIDYQNNSGSNGNINQGVQQPFEFYPLSIPENSPYTIELFPNPTSEELSITISDPNAFSTYRIFDMNGKVILDGSINSTQIMVNLLHVSAGEYHLILESNQGQSYTYKISKL